MKRKSNKSIEERGEMVLNFIRDYFDHHYISPTYEEIMKGVGVKSRGHLKPIIDKLVKEGFLERKDAVARGLRLPDWIPPRQASIHLKGYIAANNRDPLVILDEFDTDTTLEIPPSLIPKNTRSSDLYALRVKGDSMADAMIANGDTVILKQGDTWNDGDIVAIWLKSDDAVTLKKLHSSSDGVVKLKPKSHKHHTRVENMSDIRVMGCVVAVMRTCV